MTWEAEQAERHEYLRGEVFAMTGARDAHNTVSGNIFAALRTQLRGGPCRAFIADMKLRVDAADASFYPDVMVTCDARDRETSADLAKRYPALLVEQDRRHVDLFRREADGRWVLEPAADGRVALTSVGATLTLEVIYEDVSGPDQ